MSEHIYKWKRFWCPQSGGINLDDGGFLFNPDTEWGKHYNPDLVTFQAICDLPCLVLLGEPGIGKTKALETEINVIESKIKEQGHEFLHLNLRSYSSEDRLVRSLFESSELTRWYAGTNKLHIFLDSLDECLLRIDTLATLLVDEFKHYRNEINRLYLRIACRTAVWPKVLEEGLETIWGKNSVKVYELAPLRKADIREAATVKGFNSDDFLKEIVEKDIVPLAIKPVTLKFLLNTYRPHGSQFLANLRLDELYLEGCKCLCEEVNSSRRDSNLKGNLDPDQRLIAAARIAALTIFCNRFAIWVGINQGDVPAEDILLQNLCYGHENANERQFEITREVIREVLDTGLFSSRGSSRMGWAHQSYAEFLAAWYLTQHQLEKNQIWQLIAHQDDRDHKIVPQLRATVTWLACMNAQVFDQVMQTEPYILPTSEIATVDETYKEKLVESLLKLCHEEKLDYQDIKFLFFERNLNHSHLLEQLQPYICDQGKSLHSRIVAIEMARVCNLQNLQSQLVEIALNNETDSGVRIQAALSLCSIGDEKVKSQLKPLAISKPKNEGEEILKAYGLDAVWPNHITAQELFDSLTQPISTILGGEYQGFIAKKLGQCLQPLDLPVALKWLEKQPVRGVNYPFDQVSDAILLKAWEHLLDQPEILPGFAKVIFLRLREYHYVFKGNYSDQKMSFSQLVANDDQKRRELIKSIISILPDSEREPIWLISDKKPIILDQDFHWLIERVQTSENEDIQRIWAKLTYWKFNNIENKFEHIDAVLTASQTNPILEQEFVYFLKAIELDSPTAQEAKKRYLERQKPIKVKEKPILEPPPKQLVIEVLNRLEDGNLDYWTNLCCEMTLEIHSTLYGNLFKSILTSFPGWIEAEDSTKLRIIKAAKLYINDGIPENQTWLETNQIHYSAIAAYQALCLLLQRDPIFISNLSAEKWEKWTGVILKISSLDLDFDRNFENRQKLLKKAYQNAPDEFIKILLVLINVENDCVHIITKLGTDFWDDRLAREIFNKVKDETLTAKSVGCLLGYLLAYGMAEAKSFAESLIPSPPPKSDPERAKAIAAASALIVYAEDAGWPVVWSAIKQDSEFGRELLETMLFYKVKIEQKLKEDSMADLYIFLARDYPDLDNESSDNEKLMGVQPQTISPINTLRDSIPRLLQQSGTPESCKAFRKIMCELPELKDKLQWRLLEAEALTRRRTWQPPQPEHIRQLIFDQNKRLVQNGHQLLDVLIESLDRLQLELQGETPAARDLWDKNNKSFKPVDENAFSDYVKRFLDKDLKSQGIIVNREVELRPNSGGNPGEITDIHVDAVLKSSNNADYDSVTVIIEVKGCWHREVKTAMKTQLVERYLADNTSPYGLHLVGWFYCKQWDNQDQRKNKTPKLTIDEAKEIFEEQAKKLSSDGNIVRTYVLNTALR